MTEVPVQRLLPLLLLAAACGPKAPPPPAHDLRAEIQARDDGWSAAYIAGDSATMAGFYTTDVVSMQGGAADIVGRDSMVANLVRWMRTRPDTILSVETRITSLHGTDSVAFESGTTLFRGRKKTEPNGKIGRAAFKYTTLWIRQPDGVWRIQRDLAVADLLPPE